MVAWARIPRLCLGEPDVLDGVCGRGRDEERLGVCHADVLGRVDDQPPRDERASSPPSSMAER